MPFKLKIIESGREIESTLDFSLSLEVHCFWLFRLHPILEEHNSVDPLQGKLVYIDGVDIK